MWIRSDIAICNVGVYVCWDESYPCWLLVHKVVEKVTGRLVGSSCALATHADEWPLGLQLPGSIWSNPKAGLHCISAGSYVAPVPESGNHNEILGISPIRFASPGSGPLSKASLCVPVSILDFMICLKSSLFWHLWFYLPSFTFVSANSLFWLLI